MPLSINGIILEDDVDYPLLGKIVFNVDRITDELTGNFITFDRLTYLPTGLAALTVPSNTTTCNVNDAIQLQDYNTTLSPPLVHSEVRLGGNPLTLYGLEFNSTETIATTISNDNGNDMNITAGGTLTITADDNITLTSSGLGNINLDAPNVDSYTYAMPICFTRERSDTFTYNYNGTGVLQTWELVYTTSFGIPTQFVADSPALGYTSTYWKIDVALNCYNNTTTADKGIAIYIDFEDTASNIYSPLAYNLTTPYAVYQPASTFTNAPQPPFQNFNWTDVIDLAGLATTGAVPLNMRLWWAGDATLTCNFYIVVTLTRTNLA